MFCAYIIVPECVLDKVKYSKCQKGNLKEKLWHAAKRQNCRPHHRPKTEKWKGDTFSGVMNEYKMYTGGSLKLTPRKEARLLYSMYYFDDEESSSGDESGQSGHKRKSGDDEFSDVSAYRKGF